MGKLNYQIYQDVSNKYIDVDGLSRFQQLLVQCYDPTDESEIVKRTRAVLAKALRKARKEGITKIGAKIPNNQRHAEKALRTRVYSKKSGVLGGNITILRGRRNGHSTPRPIPPTKSGRARHWSERTKQLWGYQGEDAQFLLYWLSQGTRDRQSGLGRSDRNGNYGDSYSRNRKPYFGGTHNVGRINPDTINPELLSILERVVNNEVIPEIDKLYSELANK